MACPTCGTSYAGDTLYCPADGAPLGRPSDEVHSDPMIGVEVPGGIEIQRLIGMGSMGRVYRARQTTEQRFVAVKFVHPQLLADASLVARFVREMTVTGRILHPNVVRVLTSGTLLAAPPDGQDVPYLVMEFLDGVSLRSRLAASGGSLPLPVSLDIICQACDAVGHAHANGIVHRDLKPANVMLIQRGQTPDFVKVLDFGAAKVDWSDPSVATKTGAIFGTARYVSPEGARGEPVGAPADVYSLTTMLYECLTGTTPFDGDNPVSILIKHARDPAPDVRSHPKARSIPEPIAAIVADNLAKNPAQRCTDARALGQMLHDAAAQSGLRTQLEPQV